VVVDCKGIQKLGWYSVEDIHNFAFLAITGEKKNKWNHENLKGSSEKERLQDEKVSENTLSLSLFTPEEKVRGKTSIRMKISILNCVKCTQTTC